MERRILISLISAFLFSILNFFSSAQEHNKSLNDVKDVKKVHQLNAGIKAKAKSINSDFLVFSQNLKDSDIEALANYMHGLYQQ